MTDGNSTPLWMQGISVILILAPLLVPYGFRRWIDQHPQASPPELESVYVRLNWALLLGMICGVVFLQTETSMNIAFANLALTLFAFVWMERDRKHWVQVRVSHERKRESFADSFRPFLFIILALTLLSEFDYLGILFMFLGAPLWVRIFFKSSPMEPSQLRTQIETVFKTAKVPLQNIYIFNRKKAGFSNALVCGFAFAPKPFGRTLFVSESLFSTLEPDEVLAVLHHEAAHFKKSHISKRIAHMVLIYLAAVFIISVPVLTTTVLLDRLFGSHPQLSLFLGGLAAFAGILMMNRRLFQIIHHQEFEADTTAVQMGAQPQSLIRALHKLDDQHGGFYKKKQGFLNRWLMGRAHPSLEERESAISAGILPTREPWVRDFRPWAVAYSTMLVVLGVYLTEGRKPHDDPSKSRQPASISDPK